MSFSLLESVQKLFPKEFIAKTASILDENPKYVADGITGIIPSVLTGLMQKGTSPDGLAAIAKHSGDAKDVKFHDSLSKIITGKNYTKYEKLFDSAEDLFGEKLSDITHKVSINSGLRETSANWLIRLITPTALGVLGEHIKKNKLNITDAAHVIANERESIIKAVPEEYNLTSVYGFSSLQDIGDKFSNAVSFTTHELPALPKEPEVPAIHSIIDHSVIEPSFSEPVIPTVHQEVIHKVLEEPVVAIPKVEVPVVEAPVFHEPVIEAPKEETYIKPIEQIKPTVNEEYKTVVVTTNIRESSTQPKIVKTNPAFKWKVLSWVLLVIFFILLIVLFNILPPMFRI